MSLTKTQILQWFENCQQVFTEQRDYLTELDTAIGDGDHGLNMQRGFAKVAEKLPTVADKDIGTIFKTVGMTLLSQVGGASGPLYGTLFIKAAQSATGKEALSFVDLRQALNDGVAGVLARGRAEIGDKTMIDVWQPVLNELNQANETTDIATALQSAVKTAKVSLEATIPLVAKKGRASYLAERSAGHQDPGATSTVLLLEALAKAAN